VRFPRQMHVNHTLECIEQLVFLSEAPLSSTALSACTQDVILIVAGDQPKWSTKIGYRVLETATSCVLCVLCVDIYFP